MKKILAILLILALSFTLLCSCSEDTQTDKEKEGSESKVTAVTTISNNSPYDEGETTVVDFSNLIANENGIEIYGKNSMSFVIPGDGMMEVILLLKNTNDFDVHIAQGSDYDVNSDNFSGSITDYCRDFLVIAHPNGCDFIIEANSEMTYIFDISLPDFNNQDESLEGDLIFSYEFKFFNHGNGAEVADINLKVNADIKYVGRNDRSHDSDRNAVIQGIVVDSNSNPISDVEIEVFNTIDEGYDKISTDENGKFEIKLTASKSANTNLWHECVLRFWHSDYDEKYICVYPKENETNEVQLVLLDPSDKLEYENTAVVDLGIQGYTYDTDEDKSVIAFTPFHSGLNYDEIKDKLSVNFTDFDGNVIFNYPLNAEAPWICVSDDGNYVVAIQAVDGGNESSTYINVLNKEGDVVYSLSLEMETDDGQDTKIIHSRCAELSHDNKYLAVGSDDGDFWLLDWQNDKVLWTYKSHGQVRNFIFNEDNSKLYVSGGDGYMYGLDTDGNLLFKTWVGSWAPCMELADNYLVYTLKTVWGQLGCIDVETGEKLWVCPALGRGLSVAVSKDKKYVWAGTNTSNSFSCINNAVYDIKTGEIAYVLNIDAGQAGMYSDDGRYLVVKTATKLQVFETENYSCVWDCTVVTEEGENTASVNESVAVNMDGSKIVAPFNNDPSCRYYGQAYYFTLK